MVISGLDIVPEPQVVSILHITYELHPGLLIEKKSVKSDTSPLPFLTYG